MRLYLLPIRNGASATYNEGMDKWLRNSNHILRDINQTTKTVEFNSRVQQIQDLARCENGPIYTRKKLERHLGNQGVSADGMLVPYRHKVIFYVFVNFN